MSVNIKINNDNVPDQERLQINDEFPDSPGSSINVKWQYQAVDPDGTGPSNPLPEEYFLSGYVDNEELIDSLSNTLELSNLKTSSLVWGVSGINSGTVEGFAVFADTTGQPFVQTYGHAAEKIAYELGTDFGAKSAFINALEAVASSNWEDIADLADLGESQWESMRATAGGPNRRFAGWNVDGYSEAMTRAEASALINHPELNDLGWAACGHTGPALGTGVIGFAGFENGVATPLNATELVLACEVPLTSAIEFVTAPIQTQLDALSDDFDATILGLSNAIDAIETTGQDTATDLAALDAIVSALASVQTTYTTTGSWLTHTFPTGHRNMSIVCVGGGAGGGGGQSGAENTTRKGGGAGAGAPLVTFTGPITASTLYVNVGPGGVGGTPGNAGGSSNFSTVSTATNSTSASTIIWSCFNDAGGGAPGSGTGSGGGAGTAFNGSTRYSAAGSWWAKTGQGGGIGVAGLAGGPVTPGVFQVTGGGGGAGRSSGNSGFKGGDVNASGVALIVNGGAGSNAGNGTSGSDGVSYTNPFMSTGGAGGGSGLVGGNGGKGGLGSGGGGGGAGVTGGNGGNGGNGFVIITSW